MACNAEVEVEPVAGQRDAGVGGNGRRRRLARAPRAQAACAATG
jgi:hypothetical protein